METKTRKSRDEGKKEMEELGIEPKTSRNSTLIMKSRCETSIIPLNHTPIDEKHIYFEIYEALQLRNYSLITGASAPC